MAPVDFNGVLNAFIDALPYSKIPREYLDPASAPSSPGRDHVCAAVTKMVSCWKTCWGTCIDNFDKNAVIREVEDAMDMIHRRKCTGGLIDETKIASILSTTLPSYSDGTYQRYFAEREHFIVTKMIQLLTSLQIPVPPLLTRYVDV